MVADVTFIVNPASANGRTRRRWRGLEPVFRRALEDRIDVRMTERRGHATDLTRAAVQAGTETVVVIIGDVDFRTVRKNLPALRRGEHLSLDRVTHFRCRELRVTANEEMIDLDGEFVGKRATRFAVVPSVLPMIT